MANIKISDKLGVTLLTTPSGPGSGISKYFTGNTAAFVASAQLATALNKPVGSLAAAPLGLGMTFASDGTFGTTGVEWQFSAGAQVTVQATQAANQVPGDDVFQNPITVEAGKTLVAATFTPSLSVGLSEGIGNLQFGFTAGGSVAFRAGRLIDLAGGAGPKLGEALQSLLSSAIVPANVLDLATMLEGDLGSVSGAGTLQFSASFDIAQAFNPAASPALAFAKGKVALKAGASLEVGARVKLSGNYQIRVRKLPGDKVRLGYYKMADSQFQFDVTASAGVSATAGKTELVAKLMGLLGTVKASEISQVETGLSEEQVDELRAAVEASLSRSLAVSLAGSFATSNAKTSMFEYEFELSQLDAAGVSALNEALAGDLSALTSRPSSALPAGVQMLVSELEAVKKRKTVWKINLLGIVNVLTVSELIVRGRTLFNAETGELVVTDSVTAKKLRVETRPLEAGTKKLHKLLMQSLVITAAYRASGAQKLDASLSGSMSYFEQDANANRQKIGDYLDNFVGLQLISAAGKTAFLTSSFRGRASVFIDATFLEADFATMFFDPAGQPRDLDFYDTIGRNAIANLIQPGDENDFRRQPMLLGNKASDKLWKQMSEAGPPSFPVILPPPLNGGTQLAIIRHDYIVIKWWAESMAQAAQAVCDMRKFVAANGQSAEELRNDKKFNKVREDLTNALKDVVNDALPDFLDAWGVLVMDAAAGRQGKLNGVLITTGPVLTGQRP